MQSMTGYGKAEYNNGGINLVVEIKTVNNRFLDVVSKYPRSFIRYDDLIRKTVAAKLSRGRVEVMIQLKETEQSASLVNVDLFLAESYYNASKVIAEQFPELKNDVTVGSLMRSPDVLTINADEDDDRYFDIIKTVLENALDNLNKMRATEGEKLKADLLSRNAEVLSLVNEIAERAPLVKEDYFERLKTRMTELLGSAPYDQTRLLQEVAIFADKSNIDEEITRLKSHVSQLKQIVEQENSGKKLDFLAQEFNREANTICSKSNDVSITQTALKLKCEIEKMREQIQNVE
ncbi:MAG: YicC family protein [Clostridia bacterium]|nr:YicC family protein [Clostridia bacterium]